MAFKLRYIEATAVKNSSQSKHMEMFVIKNQVIRHHYVCLSRIYTYLNINSTKLFSLENQI